MRHLASTRRAVMALVLAMSSRAWGEAGVGVAVTMTAEELQAMNGSPVDATSTDRDGLVAMGYTLVEDTPRCYFVLGSNYCPAPAVGQSWTDMYMSSLERTSQVFSNMVRMDPTNFQALYMAGSAYACAVGTRTPFRYSSNVHQAAKQQARILADPACPFQHPTCSSYCYLYSGGNCNWAYRLMTYQYPWTSIGENIAYTWAGAANDPFMALSMWLGSSGHCSNLFSSYSHMGTGSNGIYWVQNFATYSDATSNPLIDGSHYLDASKTGGKLRYLVNYYSASLGSPTAISVVVDGSTTLPLSLHLGTAGQGTYSVDVTAPSACSAYYFQVTTSSGLSFTLPETGAYRTSGVGSCTTNWAVDRGTPAAPPVTPAPTPSPTDVPATPPPTPSPTPATPAPTLATTPAPTPAPTQATPAPTVRVTASPTRAPTRPTPKPTKRPTKAPTRVRAGSEGGTID